MKQILIICLSLLAGLSSCNLKPGKHTMSNITGKAGELVVVISSNDWQSSPGDTIRKYLMQPQPGMPQYEPLFNLVNISPDKFSNMFKTHRNLLILNKSANHQNKEIEFKKNMWAKHQASISVFGSNKKAIEKIIADKHEVIEKFFLDAEIKRNIRHYKNNQNVNLSNDLAEEHHISLAIPVNYTMDMDSNNFVWFSHETPRISQGIFIYYYDYKDTSTFTLNYLINKRNKICKKYVAGPYPGSYMGTDTVHTQFFKQFLKNDKYHAEIRGLWKLKNKGFMGGPFISLSTVDEERNRVVTVEGYVYAPGKEKRNYLRQLQSILYTLEID